MNTYSSVDSSNNYERKLNLREIGQVLNVSESRVCQIHGQAMLRLRAVVAKW